MTNFTENRTGKIFFFLKTQKMTCSLIFVSYIRNVRLEKSNFNGQPIVEKMEKCFFFNIPEISTQIQKQTKY